MATQVDLIFKKFLSNIEDESWLMIENSVIEDLMYEYLDNATAEFDTCRKDLTIENDYIVSDLNNLEILILAKGMILQYLEPKIICEKNLRQDVTSKDFSKLSNANMLDKMIKLKELTRKEFDTLQTKYDYKEFEGLN